MKILKISIAALIAFASSAFAEDPFVGEYMGSWEMFKGNPSVFARISRHGDTYKLEIIPALAQRTEHYAEASLDGFAGKDEMVFETGSSLKFSGKVKDGVLTSKVLRGEKEGELTLKRFERGSPSMGKPAPDGAIKLFDGTSLDEWMDKDSLSPCKWNLLKNEGAMEILVVQPKEGQKRANTTAATKRKFKDFKMHLEFLLPEEYATDQPKYTGNSGLYIGDVEIQIIDSFGGQGNWGDCGSIYRVSPPRVNAVLPPDRWQTYDIIYKAPRFDSDGKIASYPSYTILHNGIVVQSGIRSKHGTSHMEIAANETKFTDEPVRLSLQDHGSAVRFRNIWVLEK